MVSSICATFGGICNCLNVIDRPGTSLTSYNNECRLYNVSLNSYLLRYCENSPKRLRIFDQKFTIFS